MEKVFTEMEKSNLDAINVWLLRALSGQARSVADYIVIDYYDITQYRLLFQDWEEMGSFVSRVIVYDRFLSVMFSPDYSIPVFKGL